MHITLKNAELLKHSKLDKNAPTCFGLHRNHLQGAKVSAWLKTTRLVKSICVDSFCPWVRGGCKVDPPPSGAPWATFLTAK